MRRTIVQWARDEALCLGKTTENLHRLVGVVSDADVRQSGALMYDQVAAPSGAAAEDADSGACSTRGALHRTLRTSTRYRCKQFELAIEDQRFDSKILADKVAAEAALDGVYAIRTNVAKKHKSAADTVGDYKGLCELERASRALKTVDLKIRPIHHHLEDRVRAHIFLCMLADYVEWHMRAA